MRLPQSLRALGLLARSLGEGLSSGAPASSGWGSGRSCLPREWLVQSQPQQLTLLRWECSRLLDRWCFHPSVAFPRLASRACAAVRTGRSVRCQR
jgi:hypothetical protein